ncbi:MAG TPA: class II fructose-bisphosphate aldolase [Firmicutes bacterium]|nr:class II fructose-bisphosphate aldolase [Candidatus Fermentithermobacillaceae bacterium]
MLIRMDIILRKAQEEGYGVAAPNVFDGDSVRSCFEAALELRAPMVIDAGQSVDLEYIADVTRFYAERYPEIPVSLNLDHGKSFDAACRAIRAGFTSVMVDRSQAPFEENVRETREIVKMAHAVGVSVEAEIGHVGQGANYSADRDAGLTRVEDAVEYVKQTGVDCLAIAIGTAHGKYVGTPRLDFDRLVAIRKAVSIPLVLHGGSSTGDENLARAVQLGITKVNLATDLMVAGAKAAKEFVNANEDPRLPQVVKAGMEGYKAELIRYMKLFGEENRW